MTSLAHQLKRLALPQSDANLLTRRDVASLLFDPKDAATMDRSTFYALGCTGLEELLGIEAAFQEFQETLFSPASAALERSVQSREVNQKMDAALALFLTRLCPYFLLKPAHKCIEWLVHRFHVHLYNADSLLACALPYHDTKVFVRVLQLLKIKDATNRWNWLQSLQKPGVPLSRGTLISHCYSDLSFMDFICSMVTRSIQAFSGHTETFSQLRVIFCFYASTIVPALGAIDKLSDAIIAKLLPYVQKGLKSSLADYKAATYMIVCQLAVKVVMEAALVDSLSVHISKSLVKDPVLVQEGLGCLIVLLQNQKEGAVGPRSVRFLASIPTLASTLQVMAASHDISPLLRYLLPHLVRAVFSDCSGELETDQLESILRAVPLTKDLDRNVARLLLEQYLSRTECSSEDMSSLDQRLLPVVQLLESRYCGALDHVLAGHVTDGSESETKRLFHRFLSLSVSSGKFQILDSDTSLLLSLKHPLASVRVSAVERLMDIVSSGQQQGLDETFLKAAVVERLQDDVPEVVSIALRVLEMMLDLVDAKDAVSSLLSLLHRADVSEPHCWQPILTEAVRLLSDPRLGKADAELQQKTVWTLLPYLVLTSTQMLLPCCVARCPLLTQHPLTLNWAQELEELMKMRSSSDLVGEFNQRLVSTLTFNLSSMERFCRRDALEQLALLVQQQGAGLGGQGAGLRDRASFLVLVQTLLLGLKELSETEHLLTAQRVYTALEPPLLELEGSDDAQEPQQGVSVPDSFSETMTAYLRRCEQQPGETAEAEFRRVLMVLLRDFITALRCPSTFSKAEAWWNPEHLDTNTCCYLSLTCRLFRLLVGGASHGAERGGFRGLMKLLIQVHLPDPASLFRFMCLLWDCGGNHGDQLDLKADAILQTRALHVGGALLSVQTAATLEQLTAAGSPVIPSLLCCLTSPLRQVRSAALAALSSLSGATSPFQPIVERLLKSWEELGADPSYLNTVLAVLHDESSSSKPLQPLLISVQCPRCPSSSAAVLMKTLQHVDGQSVLATLLPVLERLLDQTGPDTPLMRAETQLLQLVLGKYDEASAPLLVTDRNCLDLFVRALKLPVCQLVALEQITKSFFSAVDDDDVQQKLLSVMFDLLVDSGSPAVASSVGGVFKAISVDGQLVARELAPPENANMNVTVQQSRRSKMTLRKRPEGGAPGPVGGAPGPVGGAPGPVGGAPGPVGGAPGPVGGAPGPVGGAPGPVGGAPGPVGGAVPWQRVTLILELLQHKKKLKRAQTLVPVLFSLLARSMEPTAGHLSNMEYTKQLLLSCLLNICNKLAPGGGPLARDVLDEDQFSVELVVQCIRTSDVPQTHHHALLLLGAAAHIFPEKVLHHIMSIFTFMGSSILRLDDVYSFRVIERTLETIVPALIQAQQLSDGSASSSHLVSVVTRILQVFVDAVPHVPDHRRLSVLSKLLSTLGPAHFLWILMLLLLKLHATQSSAFSSDRDAGLDLAADFWTSLCCQFHVSEQLSCLVHILKFLLQLPADRDHANSPVSRRMTKQKKDQEVQVEELIFSVEAHSSKELRHFKFLCLSFMTRLLGSSSFIQKVADGGEDLDASLQPLQQRLLEDVLRYVHSVAHCLEQNTNKPTAKFWRVLLNQSYEVLDKVNALLPIDSFIVVVKGLMGNELASVRRKIMELLINQLQQRTNWNDQQVMSLLQLSTDLLSIVGKSQAEGAELAVNRQTALYCLKLLCRSFGSAYQETFVPVLLGALDVVTATQEDKNVMGSALLCVAEVVAALKALAIPHLPRLMPAVLHVLSSRMELLTNDVYLLSAVTALQRITETLPHFISPYLQDITSQVCGLTLLLQTPSPSSQLATRLTSLRTTLASRLPPRVLLPTISRCYSSMVLHHMEQLEELMKLLKEHLSHMTTEQFSFHQSELTSFFLTSLDFRKQHCQGDLQKTWEVEGGAIDCLVAMVMKLSEVTFRPLFFKLLDWSKPDQPQGPERRLTFFRLCDRMVDRLKGLFVLFAGNLLEPFREVLKNHTDVLFDGSVEKTSLLLQLVLDCLSKIFLYDTQRFLSRERADVLLKPLVDQLENRLGGQQLYQQRVTQHLLPCLGQFSVALADESQWKSLNYQILLKTRHSDAKVRFSALLVLMELASRLKENYVVLLPETVPFLAELMEDECEEVEHQVQKVVQEMEGILGEPLQSYF